MNRRQDRERGRWGWSMDQLNNLKRDNEITAEKRVI
jgi:hypothetical protein